MGRTICVIVAGFLAASCASGDGNQTTVATTGTSTTVFEASLPPHAFEELEALLGPLAAPLGLEVTRASLVDVDTYLQSPSGTHLAVYVVADRELDPDGYAANLLPLAVAFLPLVFERWPGLESFDVCQEPYAWSGTGTPPSVTIVDLDREAASRVDWGAVDLAGLLAAAAAEAGMTVTANTAVRASSTWADAVKAASRIDTGG